MRRTRNWSLAGVVVPVALLLTGGVSLAAGAPTSMTLQLSPASIVADGFSTSSVVARVVDQTGTGVVGLSVFFSAVDAAGHQWILNRGQDGGNGTYSSTLTSSVTPGPVTVTATVSSPLLVTAAVLTQTATSMTSLTALSDTPVSGANPPVTNQSVAMLATVTASPANITPSGTVTFEDHGVPINGCSSVPTPAGSTPSLTVACGTSFTAAASPVSLTATFVPAGPLVLGSTSPADGFSVAKDPTTSTLTMSAARPHFGAAVRFIALVTPSQLGPALPSGSVQFLDNGKPIRSCTHQPVGPFGAAICTVRYRALGSHTITASYGGDASFASSTSSPAAIVVQALGRINATMLWTFDYAPAYTRVLTLQLNGVPTGTSTRVTCHGRGCPFRRRIMVTQKGRCPPKVRRPCTANHTLDLAQRFGTRRLSPGTVIKVAVTRRGWIGKSFRFTVRPGRAPRAQVACTAPGSSRLGAAC